MKQLRLRADNLVSQWKAGKIQRRAAVEALQVVYDGHLTVLKVRVGNTVKAKTAQSDVQLQEFLKQLEEEQIRLLERFEMSNIDAKARILQELNDRYLSHVLSIRCKDWPPSMIAMTIDQLDALRERVVQKILLDFPARYSRS